MEPSEVFGEIRQAWAASYSAEATERALGYLSDKHLGHRIAHLIARLCFRGIYFPQMSRLDWVRLLAAK